MALVLEAAGKSVSGPDPACGDVRLRSCKPAGKPTGSHPPAQPSSFPAPSLRPAAVLLSNSTARGKHGRAPTRGVR